MFSEVTVFIYDEYYVDLLYILDQQQFDFKLHLIKKENRSNRNFIRFFFSYYRQERYTHIHINTLENNLLPFAIHLFFCNTAKVSMTVHSINAFRYNLYSSPRNISESIAKKILRRCIQQYRVLAPEMKNYFKNRFPDKGVYFIPGMFYNNRSQSIKRDCFTIVIPGTVAANRRNYHDIVQLFSNNLSKYTQITKIHLVLAGNAQSIYGRHIVDQLNGITGPDFSVSSFFYSLPQKEYEAFYRDADIILAPIQIHTRSIRDQQEVNSVTHSPGFITDQIYMGRPAIIPKNMSLPAQFTDCYWVYDSNEKLDQILTVLMQTPSIIETKKEKIKLSCAFFNASQFQRFFLMLMDEKVSPK